MNSAKINPFARFGSRLGSILSAWVYAVGMSLMYIYIENDIPSTAYVAGYTLLAAGIIAVLFLSRKSFWLTLTALLVAAGTALLRGWQPIGAIRQFIYLRNDTIFDTYSEIYSRSFSWKSD